MRGGRDQHFQGGSICWSPATGAHDVAGAILSAWADIGYEVAGSGHPTSGEYDVPGGRRSVPADRLDPNSIPADFAWPPSIRA